MANKDIVVIGASTGGINALKALAGGLPKKLHASIFIVVHAGPSSPNLLQGILDRAGPLPTTNPSNREPIQPGHIYVAPPDYHLLLEKSGRIRVSHGPKENRFRPAIDPLFRSAAYAFGPRVVGIILTGSLDDGTAGLWAIKNQGGTTIVQNPENALAPSMPLSALKHVQVDHCVPLSEIAPLIVQLADTAVTGTEAKPVSERLETEVKIAQEEPGPASDMLQWGDPSIYSCPECHGVLLQLKEGSNLRFRCHTGHAYSLKTLLSGFRDGTEEALWKAIRSLNEAAFLLNRMAKDLGEQGHNEASDELRMEAREVQQRAEQIRNAMHRPPKDEEEEAKGN